MGRASLAPNFGRIMLEVVPPGRRASEAAIRKSVDSISRAARDLGCINYLNVPEIIDENRRGIPLRRNIEPREFGRLLLENTGISSAVNRIVAYSPKAELETWVRETVGVYGIRHVVFVGGNSGFHIYPGPTVTESNALAVSLGASQGLGDLHIGNVLIPERRGETDRAFAKSESGCSFFTSQIIFKPDRFKRFAGRYAERCRKAGVQTGMVFLSLAPAKNVDDIDFFKWLGCDVPGAVERRLRKSGDMGKESIRIAKESLEAIVGFIKANGIPLQIGINVESIFNDNLSLAVEMIGELKQFVNGPFSWGKGT